MPDTITPEIGQPVYTTGKQLGATQTGYFDTDHPEPISSLDGRKLSDIVAESIAKAKPVVTAPPIGQPRPQTTQTPTPSNNAQAIPAAGSPVLDNFLRDYSGQVGVPNPEGSFNGQCISLTRTFAKNYLGVAVPSGSNAWDAYANYGKNEWTDGFTKVGQSDVKPGDIAFQTPGTVGNDVGHTFVVNTVNDDGTVNIIESNYAQADATQSPVQIGRKVPITKLDGLLRAK